MTERDMENAAGRISSVAAPTIAPALGGEEAGVEIAAHLCQHILQVPAALADVPA
jgi:hypothetical protein